MRARCKRHKVRGEPGLKKYPRANSPHNNTKLFFLLEIFFGDLPCKRTCHGKGRMTKMLNQNSSQLIGALSSLTNISYILHTHLISFHISSFLLWLFPLLQSLLSRIKRVDGFIITSSIRNANSRSDDEPQSRDHESRSNIRSAIQPILGDLRR